MQVKEAHLLSAELRLGLLVFGHVDLVETLVDGIHGVDYVVGVALQADAIESLALFHGQLDLISISHLP